MTSHQKKISRRSFLKKAGSLALATGGLSLHSLSASENPSGKTAEKEMSVPVRPFGKTGVTVSILALGGMFDIPTNQLMLKQALKWGVTYWDTANSYGGGRSEEGIGMYFSRFPEDRKRVFLVTKSNAWTQNGMTRNLELSLERMRTDFIDLFFVHGIGGIDEVKETRQWAEKVKSSGKIRFFGFSTHSNMESCLSGASKLGWIDGIMTTYNYRLMKTDAMRRAVDACIYAGVGVTAMKTQGGGAVKTSSETEMALAGRFLKKGFTDGQAKLKAVWEDTRVASICSQMPALTLLMTNVRAAVDETRLSSMDRRLMDRYAHETASEYCAGCTAICESALSQPIPVGDIMRCLMYCRSYQDHSMAADLYRKIPISVRSHLTRVDYSEAERRCPQKMAISKLISEASRELS
ncbi:MAG: aldo/keto reductase [Desulfobacterales bacterium CG07_land_8_20_14_0_80_52_14]|nr:MAG: aldo/keto reductase [Desulfobacterales bacterium CG07_land_8_20_14_0_80_52_14]